MYLKKIIFILLTTIFLIISCSVNTFATSTSYIWSNSDSKLLETVSDTETDLKLQSGGAILIEQSTRFCSL